MVGPSGVERNRKGSGGTYRGIWSQLKLLESRARLHKAWIAYPADNSWKRNSVIQALNNRTLILSAKKRAIYWIVQFGGYNLSCVVHCMDGTVIFLRLIRRISYPSFVQPALVVPKNCLQKLALIFNDYSNALSWWIIIDYFRLSNLVPSCYINRKRTRN